MRKPVIFRRFGTNPIFCTKCAVSFCAFCSFSRNSQRKDVYHYDRTAYVEGNCNFQDDGMVITSDKGSYCWKTKIADFQGNVKVNGKASKGAVRYDVMTKKLVQ